MVPSLRLAPSCSHATLSHSRIGALAALSSVMLRSLPAANSCHTRQQIRKHTFTELPTNMKIKGPRDAFLIYSQTINLPLFRPPRYLYLCNKQATSKKMPTTPTQVTKWTLTTTTTKMPASNPGHSLNIGHRLRKTGNVLGSDNARLLLYRTLGVCREGC